ncbi:MAG TPA: CoB--CoM heterodisulfide reductase iron-sulfur subunit B family protein [Methanomassiliicoccales archaeon]|nr:CoB--CoM heterodisulfide reductase iron-sulfur subunit B family protein [Methanomassiliicoccales archaeon]
MSEGSYLFKGCLIPTRLPYLESASKFVLERMGADHKDLPGATCCVEPIALRSLAADTWLATVARMLCIAERDGRDIMTLCNGCYLSFAEAVAALKGQEKRDQINSLLDMIGYEYRGKAKVEHVLGWLHRSGRDAFSDMIKVELSDLKVASHSGCHVLRPSRSGLVEAPFRPAMLNDLTSWCGAVPVHQEEWPMCCGGGIAAVDENISIGILDRACRNYRSAGADCILTPCPFCFSQFDMRQKEGLPVLFLTELIAMAMGAPPSVLGLKHHRIKMIRPARP